MSDEAVFMATYAGMSSLTDGDYTVRFHVSGPNIKKLFDILTHGDKPSIAKGTWFAIARLNRGAALDGQSITPPDHNASLHGSSAQGPQLAKPSPGRSLSQIVYKEICLQPKGRAFVEEFFQDILRGQKANDAEAAKDVLRRRLGIASLSEIDTDPIASAQAEEILRWKAGWERGLETPRIQQENQA